MEKAQFVLEMARLATEYKKIIKAILKIDILPSNLELSYQKLTVLIEVAVDIEKEKIKINGGQFLEEKIVSTARGIIGELDSLIEQFTLDYENFKKDKKFKNAATKQEKENLDKLNALCKSKKMIAQIKDISKTILLKNDNWESMCNILTEYTNLFSSRPILKKIASDKNEHTSVILISDEDKNILNSIYQLLSNNQNILSYYKNMKTDELASFKKAQLPKGMIIFLSSIDIILNNLNSWLNSPNCSKGYYEDSTARPTFEQVEGKKLEMREYPQCKTIEEVFKKGKDDKEEIDANDVVQGAIGDCYALAPLMAIAKKKPKLIKDAIAINAPNGYKVRLYIMNSKAEKEPVWVAVDNSFLYSHWNKAPQGVQPQDNGEMWVMIIEKAIAKFYGSYEKLKSGKCIDIFDVLTNQKPNDLINSVEFDGTTGTKIDLTKDSLWGKLLRNADSCMTVSIKPYDKIKGTYSIEPTGMREAYKINYGGYLIYCAHGYSVHDIDEKSQTITLHNPHNIEDTNETFPKINVGFLLDCAFEIISIN